MPELVSGIDYSNLDLAIMSMGGPEKFYAWWDEVEDEDYKLRAAYDWKFRARTKQLPPDGDWSTWICRCGRGWGKTLTGAEWVRMRVEEQGARNIALVAPTAADVRDVMVEGPSGILAISPPWFRPTYEPSKRRITWPNGATATTFSADEPRSLRGPQYDTAWCDELAHWRYLDDSWDNLQFGLRMRDARCLVTSSPRPLKFLRDLESDPESITHWGSTYENAGNLPTKYLAKLKRRYDGTRLGRQEIFAEILTDNPNALWLQKKIDDLRVSAMPQDFIRVVVAVDPAITAKKKSDETGIIGAGTAWCKCRGAREIHGFVFEDRSGIYKPEKWGRIVVDTYDEYMADLVVAEVNQGGDMVERNVRATEGGENISYKGVHASRGKQMRHEPISNLYEQGKCHHVGVLSRLEDQQTQWDPTQGDSPDRIDANTIALTELMLEKVKVRGEVGITVIG